MTEDLGADWVTTSTLLARLSEFDDRDVWGKFAERFRGPVLAFARRRGLGTQDAEDASQETLLAFAQAFREGRYDRKKGRLSDWLFGIAWHRVEQTRRRGAKGNRQASASGGDSVSWSAVPEDGEASRTWVGSSRVDLQACKLEYSIVSPK